MPIFDFVCQDCSFADEHFIYSGDDKKSCPKCNSEKYLKQCSAFLLTVEYSDPQENYEKNIQPHIDSIYQKIGKESLDGDTKTMSDVFGENKVNQTFSPETQHDE